MIDLIRAATRRKCPWCHDGGESRMSELFASMWLAKPWRGVTLRLDSAVGRIGTRIHERHEADL